MNYVGERARNINKQLNQHKREKNKRVDFDLFICEIIEDSFDEINLYKMKWKNR
jgi:hypothetical protein